MQISVITSIVGGKDTPVETQIKGNADWIAFNEVATESKVWEMRPSYDKYDNDRRNSRMPKLMPHQFVDTEYSIWLDGNCSLLQAPEILVNRYLKDHDLAVFKHPNRDCIYDEATKCAVSKLDDPETIIGQVSRYEKEGYAKHKGLCECMLLIRRHTPKVQKFNETWFQEWDTGSVRDQISFMYAVDKVGLRINVIDLPWVLAPNGVDGLRGDFFRIEPHAIANPQIV